MKNKKELKNLLLWELVLGVLLTISFTYFPSKLSVRELLTINPDSVYTLALMMYTVLQLFCLAFMFALFVSNTTMRANIRSTKKTLFIATMKFIHRPSIVWIIRITSLPIFAVCAIGIFGCPKPCDTTFIDTPLRIVWGNKGYKRWHNLCLRMHYRIVYA